MDSYFGEMPVGLTLSSTSAYFALTLRLNGADASHSLLFLKIPRWQQLTERERMLWKHNQEAYNREARRGSKALYFSSSLEENVCRCFSTLLAPHALPLCCTPLSCALIFSTCGDYAKPLCPTDTDSDSRKRGSR
jgi:hypothetical protein